MSLPLYQLVLHGLAVAALFGQSLLDSSALAKKVLPSLVEIKGFSNSKETGGSGFIVTSDGRIATSLHVISVLDSGAVRLSSGEIFDKFTVIAVDERRDLAIIKIAGFDLPTLELGNSSQVEPGEAVMLLGNPHGLQGTMTTGIVSAVRDLPEGIKVIQTDAAANPGNSGGPMINAQGQAIGVVGFKIVESENLNFAIPINYIRGLLFEADTNKPLSLAELRATTGKRPDRFREQPVPADPVVLLASSETIYVYQAEGNPELLAAVQQELIKWKKYRLVTSQEEGDLMLLLAPTADPNLWFGKGAKSSAFLKSKNGSILWTTVKGGDWSMAGYSFPRVGRAIVKELQKFVDKELRRLAK